ncbi:R3H domain containing protein [Gracilaria domingensis]|nr:R3H domain containing protein [Gracilaria domingensis]
MPRQNNRRNNGRNSRRANRRNNRNHTRRDSIVQLMLSDSESPPSIVDSDECSTSTLSSAAEDYIANLAHNGAADDYIANLTDNGAASDLSDFLVIDAPRESSPPPVQHPAIVQGLLAYDVFSAPDRTTKHYVCRPDKSAVLRLALHRAAEVLGATSESTGHGKERQVVITMDVDQNVTIARDEFKDILEEIVESLFSAPKKKGGRGRERQKDRKRRLQIERRERKAASFLEERITTSSLRTQSKSNRSRKQNKVPAERVGRANVGYGMLERMGWSEGQGLGAEGEGLREPLEAERRRTRAGLGC